LTFNNEDAMTQISNESNEMENSPTAGSLDGLVAWLKSNGGVINNVLQKTVSGIPFPVALT
jgi:hypothetical protein